MNLIGRNNINDPWPMFQTVGDVVPTAIIDRVVINFQ